jgi:NADPH:quinone reductase
MRAWQLHHLGGLQELHLAEVADPAPAAGEVLVRLKFAALNPADRYLAEGQYPARPALPHILGRDGVGEVLGLGEGASHFAIGERVAVLRGETGVSRAGTFAEKVIVAADELVRPPKHWRDEEAAGATLVYLTAYQALTQFEPLPEGAVVLITGASGGVGVASVQLARAMGLHVIAQSRDEQKRHTLRELGASLCVDPQDSQWRRRVKEHLGERRVDLAIDNIGGELFSEVLDTLGMNGRVSCVGRLAGPVPQFNTASLFFRRITIKGVAVGTYTRLQAHAAWQEVLSLLERAQQRPRVDSVHPFEQLHEAFERLAAGPMGKVLLKC